ncbi:MAG: glutamate--tRNA ligase [Alloprevotella sp.]|nr:glutamate--tRNA ligase [Bacteroidales bacterium]MCI6728217.1 glutamate--tRNA ligase [Bacteroidales bacterium]MDY2915303.1 glutamate--tRNA ligase [Alloprevotella sp.]MDY4740110.1 glutamate--tRNA ligase [Alloprevotella sp.]
MDNRKVRVRFAPSPTGPLHIGGVRTALYNYLFARQHGGELIFRIEDTDSQRFVKAAEDYIIESFKWLGIQFDEGVSYGGDKGPYRQSERREIYKKYVDQLLEEGKAYIAFDTPEELQAKRAEIENFQYDAHTRHMMRNSLVMPADEVQALIESGAQYVVRFKIEPGEDVHVDDMIRGDVKINSSILDDKVLFKSADQLPTYHLANIVDDHLMEITHVIRGEEWLPSAPLHVLLYRAFGWADTMPRFAHLPLLLKPDGKGKLSKRDGDRLGFPVFPLEWHGDNGEVAAGYRENGYLPEAVVNFLALLGWNPGGDQEILSMDDLIRLFDITKCSKAGAKFDYVKGQWFNREYILKTDNKVLAPAFDKILRENGIEQPIERVEAVVGMMKMKKINFIKELWPLCDFFFIAPTTFDREDKFIRKNWKENAAEDMRELAEILKGLDDFSIESQRAAVDPWAETTGKKPWNAWRVALVGAGKGPDMYELAAFLGKEETLRRIAFAVETLG